MSNSELNAINSLARTLKKQQPTRKESIENLKQAGILDKNGSVNKYYKAVISYES